MNLRSETALTFDDVLLVPKRSTIASRQAVNTRTLLSRRMELKIPVVSSNMDTVTEAPMAIAMARLGGIGVIHRFMTIERQASEVSRVKHAGSFIMDHPYSVSGDSSVRQAREEMEKHGVGGLMVLGKREELIGVVSTRDVMFEENESRLIHEVMTSREKLVTVGAGTSLDDARSLLHTHRLEKLPVVDHNGHLLGLITAQDVMKVEHSTEATRDSRGLLCVAAAVGVKSSDVERAEACVNAGADVLVVDIAHGHSDLAMAMVRDLKQKYPHVDVMGGNVATAEGVRDLVEAGADAIKVGVGSGSICITRVVTGFGVPQLTAIADCARAGHELGVPIIADGGIRTSGDLTKALAAGASTVMIGSMLAGTDESPGATVVRDGRRVKVVRGMASLTANIDRKEIEQGREVDPEDWEKVVPEGVEAVVPFRGPAKELVHQLVGGLRSGLSYAGATTLAELWENAEFIRITSAGKRESGVHDVTQTF